MTEKHEQIIRDYIEAYNNFDAESMAINMTDDIKFENRNGEEITMELSSKKDFILQAKEAAIIFCERHQTIKNITYNANQAEVEISYRGIIASDVMNTLKQGEAIELAGKSIFTFNEDNKITSLTDCSYTHDDI